MEQGSEYDVVIIGAGITGSLIAWYLSQQNKKVLVLEAKNDVSMGASKANSGIIHGGYAEKYGLRASLCYPGRMLYPELEKRLQFGFRQTGSLVLAFSPEEEENLHSLMNQGRENGVHDLSLLSGTQILDQEPSVHPGVRAGLWCPGAGIASPYELVIAAMEQGVAHGITLRLNAQVKTIEEGNEKFLIGWNDSKENFSQVRTSFIVNAAGNGAQEIAECIQDNDINLHFRKGEYLLFRKGTGDKVNSVLFQVPTKYGKGILVTPTVHGNLMIGPDAQNDTEPNDTGTDILSLLTILEHAKRTLPDIPVEYLIRTFSGIRAVDESGDFVIRSSKVNPRFIHAAGIQSPGLTAGPMIAQRVLELLKEQGLELKGKLSLPEAHRSSLIRHLDMEPQELASKSKLPLGNPDRIICRCEKVNEGTIRNALDRGLPVLTPDGVKRRTRAGMGWCQGQFCRPRVVGLLQDHYKNESGILETEDVVHSGISRVRREEFKKVIQKEGME